MAHKYCSVCGKKMITYGEPVGYNTETGAKKYKIKCESDLCEHDGVKHDWELLEAFSWPPTIHDGTCKKCGKKYYIGMTL